MNNFGQNPYNRNNAYAPVAQSAGGSKRAHSARVLSALYGPAGDGGRRPGGRRLRTSRRRLFLPLFIGTLVCVFALSFTRTNPGLSLVLLYALSVMEGLLMGPLLGVIARGYPYGAAVIGEAALLSAVIVAGLGSYVWISGKDFGGLGKFLILALIGLMVVGLLRFFVAFSPGVTCCMRSSARPSSSGSRCTTSRTSSSATGRTITSWRRWRCTWTS